MAKQTQWFYGLFILLLLFLPVIFVEAISHVPLDLIERDLRASPVKRLTSKHPNDVKKKALCDHCCGSSCWWDERATVCRCPHLPSIIPKKHPPIPSMTLASLARSHRARGQENSKQFKRSLGQDDGVQRTARDVIQRPKLWTGVLHVLKGHRPTELKTSSSSYR